MRTIVHLSDLHFGRVNPHLIAPLIGIVEEIRPDLIAISGDLTQRARSHEFQAAREFLNKLPQPQIVVPGNHDVPLHNVFSRFLQPLEKYQRYITSDLQPTFTDDEMAVVGMNTARSLTIKGGRINHRQVARIRDTFCVLPDDVTKVVVTHHPFDLPDNFGPGDLVGRARMAMTRLAECGADVFLAGHLHVMHTGHTAKRYKIRGHSALVIQAGTASSTRGRGETNSFNIVTLNHPEISVERAMWQPESNSFVRSVAENFRHTVEGWVRE